MAYYAAAGWARNLEDGTVQIGKPLPYVLNPLFLNPGGLGVFL